MKETRDEIKTSREEQARERPGNGDIEFLFRFIGLAADAGEPAEDEERDGLHGNFVAYGDDAVAELVKNDRAEEEGAGDDAEKPVLLRSPTRVLRSELRSERERDESEDDEPAGVEVYRDAEDACREDAGYRAVRPRLLGRLFGSVVEGSRRLDGFVGGHGFSSCLSVASLSSNLGARWSKSGASG